MAGVEANLKVLADWAASIGVRLVSEPGLSDDEISIFPELITPFWGEFSFEVPPSYRALLRVCGGFELHYNYSKDDSPDWAPVHAAGKLYSPDEIIDAHGGVMIPEFVSVEKDMYLSTNHLLGFGRTNSSPCYSCFVTDSDEGGGELSIVDHDTDERSALCDHSGVL